MAEFHIIEAKLYHCGRMARIIRDDHRKELERLGLSAHRGLRNCFAESSFRKAWLIDGELAALGGITGSPISTSGFMWLAVSEKATRYKIAIMKEAKKQIEIASATRHTIVTTILLGDGKTVKFDEHLGFVRGEISEDGEMMVMRHGV